MKDIVQSLGKVSELWLDLKQPLREETILALQVSTGFSRRQIELALTHCFEELTEPKMAAYVADWDQVPTTTTMEIGTRSQSQRQCVFHILPANAFTAWVHGAVISLLMGWRCWLKPSIREPVFSQAWKKSLELVDPGLASRVEIISMGEDRLRESRAVIAYGSDETLGKIRARLPPEKRFVGYGHKLSVGVIFKEAADEKSIDDLLERVRADVEPFRLQGCLSPQVLYVENPRFTRWPALEAAVDVAPKIKPFERWTEVAARLEKFNPYLSCVGYAGSAERRSPLERELRDHVGLRICRLGDMQRPPLSWRNGGISLAEIINTGY